VAAYREREHGRLYLLPFLLYAGLALGLLGVILWRLWTAVLAQWPL
jgi:hypothetical protein